MSGYPSTHRLSVLAVTLAAVFVTACTSGSPVPSVAPTIQATSLEQPSPDATPATPTPTAGSPVPTDGQPSAGLAWGKQVQVTADGLAVRRWPTMSSPLVRAVRFDPTQGAWLATQEEVRLNAGHLVTVWMGPIRENGIEWFHVFSYPQPDQAAEDEVRWDADGNNIYGDYGWIAVSLDGQAYVALRDVELDPHAIPPLVEAAGGSGTFESEPFNAEFQVARDAALLVGGDLAPCNLEVTLEPTGATLYATSLAGVVSVEHFASSQTEPLPAGEYRIRVSAGVPNRPDADCSWAIVVFQAQG